MNLRIKPILTNIELHTKWIKQLDPISNLLIKSREKKYQKRSPNQPNKTNPNPTKPKARKAMFKGFHYPSKKGELAFHSLDSLQRLSPDNPPLSSSNRRQPEKLMTIAISMHAAVMSACQRSWTNLVSLYNSV